MAVSVGDDRMVRPMAGADFVWAAGLMERRRQVYATFAPVFWRPADGVRQAHADFLRSRVESGAVVGLRSDDGFLVAAPVDGWLDVDDFAVEPDGRWPTAGRALLEAVVDSGALPAEAGVRVVTARRDAEKRQMLHACGLTVGSRWWVKELRPASPAAVGAVREVDLGTTTGLFVPAPPVYDPGGPVCLLGDVESDAAVVAADRAGELGAVLAVVTRTGTRVPRAEPALAAAGFDNVSEFFEGRITA